MTRDRLKKILDNFSTARIGVIGDLMIDQFIWGDVDRISPEAPVPVVLVNRETYVIGGAGNTANNIISLGGQVDLVGMIGDDFAGKIFTDMLAAQQIGSQGVIKSGKWQTSHKVRVVGRGQHIVRFDREKKVTPESEEEKKMLNYISSMISEWDCLVISDYVKGLLSQDFLRKILKLAQESKIFIITDTKAKDIPFLGEISLITPNLKEAREISGEFDIDRMGNVIRKKTGGSVLITQGSEGMTLFTKSESKHFPVKVKEVFDVSGAGDTVVAAIALAVASLANLEEAAVIANYAAGIVVGKIGTASVSLQELKKAIDEQD